MGAYIYFVDVENTIDEKYDKVKRIVAKRFKTAYSTCIMFEDVETGLLFSYTIKTNFSKKNIAAFLYTKFKTITFK